MDNVEDATVNNTCTDCSQVFGNPDLREKFGVTSDTETPMCHDICVQNVRLLAAKEINITQNLTGLNGCRGGIVDLSDVGSCRIVVSCADEKLCPDCTCVNINVKGFVILEDRDGEPKCALQLLNLDKDINEFMTFPEGEAVTGDDLEEILRIIDGSCIVVNLSCRLNYSQGTPISVTIEGTIVDKLWKNENIWVNGLTPYNNAITVKQEFDDNHSIPPCNNNFNS
jgi:hypothetical protein